MHYTFAMFRFCKISIVGAIAVMGLLVVLGNCTDYYTNYHFVEHVLKMDTIFAGSQVRYRQITNPVFYHVFYIALIAAEALMTILCIAGCLQMARACKASAQTFNAAKKWAVAGITIGVLIWFFGFEVVGGEWFSMWQSSTWNGLGSAERIVGFLMLSLILLHLKDGQLGEH
jgi:predicted small integral membrane protein